MVPKPNTMKKINLLLIVLFAFASSSFKTKPARILKTGTYGVCDCSDNTGKPVSIELKLNNDNTFSYVDNTVSAKVKVTGNYSIKGNTIYLENYKSDSRIHSKWTIDNNEKCLKSRKNLEWRRLCLVKGC
ncbi:MAG: hypothetical protein K0S32_2111 [Bacteroidetes bacterium]|jgi:hypothetical protein|nr:hypothetical protein [Bacteroidota bacterium]